MKTLKKLRKMMLTRQSSAQLQRMIFQKNMNAVVDIITTTITMANADVDTTIMTMNAVAQTMTRRNVAAVTTTATDL